MKAVRQAVIDIGSNTVRLVVYAGLPRAPMPIYNEKSRVKLGACLAGDGEIDKATMKKALAALARFETLARAMQVDSMRVVATAATREAKNGHELVEKAAALGIRVDVLDGKRAARIHRFLSAQGVGVADGQPNIPSAVCIAQCVSCCNCALDITPLGSLDRSIGVGVCGSLPLIAQRSHAIWIAEKAAISV